MVGNLTLTKSPESRLPFQQLVQANIKENIKASNQRPFVRRLHRPLMVFTDKWEAMRKVFPYHDKTIMMHITLIDIVVMINDFTTKRPSHTITSSNGNIFRVTGHLCGEFTGPRWIPAQRPVTRSFDFPLIFGWINGWVNNREAGDLRRYSVHYDVIVMKMATIFQKVCMYNTSHYHCQIMNSWHNNTNSNIPWNL